MHHCRTLAGTRRLHRQGTSDLDHFEARPSRICQPGDRDEQAIGPAGDDDLAEQARIFFLFGLRRTPPMSAEYESGNAVHGDVFIDQVAELLTPFVGGEAGFPQAGKGEDRMPDTGDGIGPQPEWKRDGEGGALPQLGVR